MFCKQDRAASCAQQSVLIAKKASKITNTGRSFAINRAFAAVCLLFSFVLLQISGLALAQPNTNQTTSSRLLGGTQDNCSVNLLSEEDFLTLCENSNYTRFHVISSSPLLKQRVKQCPDFKWEDLLVQLLRGQINHLHCNQSSLISNKLSEIEKINQYFHSTLWSSDCSLSYALKKNCTKCEESYMRWLCMMEFSNGNLKPCLEICNDVYRDCPAFEPDDNYGGYSVFECPAEVTENSSYGPKEKCKNSPSER